MNQLTHGLVGLLILLAFSVPARACFWDYDTLKMERQRFPETLELITGKFLRHSPVFYQARIRDRERRLAEQPTPSVYDDLAVAYEKLGQHDQAIAITLQKEQNYPGLYETQANLGTFYIHAGQHVLGVQAIQNAIAINPQAHFGREVYQLHLVNYVLSRQTDGTTHFPLDDSERVGMLPSGFAKYLLEAESVSADTDEGAAELKDAMKGVLGMMRFGRHDSPILLEALGDLLLSHPYPEDAKRLAARAYLKASYGVDDDVAREAYRTLATQSLAMQTVHGLTMEELSLEALEAEFAVELTQANRWFDTVAKDERQWSDAGLDIDAAFAQKYYEEPELNSSTSTLAWVIAIGALIGLGSMWLLRRRRNKQGSVAI